MSQVVSNPGIFNDDGCLRVTPYCATEPHACDRCAANLCKGTVVDLWRAADPTARFMYIGDGANDLCPALRLGAGDLVFARAGYRLAALLRELGEGGSRARVIEWGSHTELLAAMRAEVPTAGVAAATSSS